MSIKTIICDDEQKFRDIIKKCINNFKMDEIEVIDEAENGIALIEKCKKQVPDLIILDIQMPNLNGIETAKILVKNYPNINIIFVTAFKDYAADSYSVHALGYILKPINIKEIEEVMKYTIQRILKEKLGIINNKVEIIDKITIKTTDKEIINLEQNDIIFIETNGRKINIHTLEGIIEVNDSLSHIETTLSNKKFIKTHISYIVNINKIKKVSKPFFSIESSREITFYNYDKVACVSKNYFKDLETMMKNVEKNKE